MAVPSLGGLPEVPCVRCGRRGRLEWGALCPLCQAERVERASRISRWLAVVGAVLVGVYAVLRLPQDQRWYAAIAAVAVYLIVRRLGTRILAEALPRDWEQGRPPEPGSPPGDV